VLAEPRDERSRRLQLGADELVAGGLVQPRLERMAASHGQLLQAQAIDARVVGRKAPRRPLQAPFGEGEARPVGRLDGALECRSPAPVLDRRRNRTSWLESGWCKPAATSSPSSDRST
jgi:hypothetical protein